MSSQEEKEYVSETENEPREDEEVKNTSANESGNDDNSDNDDDLFGEGSDKDENKENNEAKSSRGDLNDFIEEDKEDKERQVDEDQQESEEEEQEEEREINAIDLDLAKHPATNKSDKDESYFVNLPAFLNIEPLPFDAPAFKESIVEKEHLSEEDKIMEKLFAENVIRWRYNKVGDKVYKQSNAHFVEWSDGSLSLKLGNELFDVVRNPTSDHFLTVRHNDLEIFQTDTIFSRNMKFIPSSTNSEIHKRLTDYIKSKNAKSDTVNSALLDVDPEEILRKREREEGEAIRHQRRLEQKRLVEEERMEKTGRAPRATTSYSYGYDDEEDDEEAAVAGKTRNGGYFDEEDDDDFVAEDDEEIASEEEEDDLERSERLNKLKESGMKRYQDNEEPEEGEDEETTVRSSKKRRVIADDEEDDY